MNRTAMLCVALLPLASCSGDPARETGGFVAADEEAALTKAQGATRELMTTLIGRLRGALQDGATVDALRVCADVAQEITDRVREEQGVELRRTALRVRNPANAPDDYERAWLEEHRDDPSFGPGGVHEVVTGPDGRRTLRYLRPIVLQALCVQCHGAEQQIDAETREALETLYPEDEATGYAAGELRGVVSVTVPIADG